MNKAELIKAMADKTGGTIKDSEANLNAIVSVVTDTLKAGQNVQLMGFGTFEVRYRKGRDGRNPKKPGEIVKIAPCKAPVFKPGKGLKDSVNK
jgi:DNA-binding protein HU-beta